MARDFIKISNDKKGFRMLLALEVLVAGWALAATVYAIRTGRTRTVIYGSITMVAVFYILGRSFRNYRNIVKQEKEEAARTKEDQQA